MMFIDGLNHLEVLTGYGIWLFGVARRKGGGVCVLFNHRISLFDITNQSNIVFKTLLTDTTNELS